ncbi:MAG: glucose-6-phosphate isomerase, partial [Clostridia bacterium]|nr:glucose-6-phosphate isomerase [Clostridia bacterium]
MSKINKKEMVLRLDYNNMMSDYIGDKEGISDSAIAHALPDIKHAFNRVKAESGKGMMGWTELPFVQDAIVTDILLTAKDIRRRFKNFVVLGIGGSALGPISVFQALCHMRYNELPLRKRKGPKFYVEDNVDPERMQALLDVINPTETVFNVITKSGATSETMSQYLIITDILKKALGSEYKNNIIATTDTKKGNLIKLAQKEGFKTYYIPDGVGGRFSELCPVGLLPAAVLGI